MPNLPSARPTYPAKALSHIHSALPASRPLNIIEIGAGTGLFTRLLLAPPAPANTLPSTDAGTPPDGSAPPTPYPTWPIAALCAIDPSEGMRAQFDKSLEPIVARSGAEVHTLDGGFHDLSEVRRVKGPEWRADLVVIAQAWHWCHPEYGRAIVGGRAVRRGVLRLISWSACRKRSNRCSRHTASSR